MKTIIAMILVAGVCSAAPTNSPTIKTTGMRKNPGQCITTNGIAKVEFDEATMGKVIEINRSTIVVRCGKDVYEKDTSNLDGATVRTLMSLGHKPPSTFIQLDLVDRLPQKKYAVDPVQAGLVNHAIVQGAADSRGLKQRVENLETKQNMQGY